MNMARRADDRPAVLPLLEWPEARLVARMEDEAASLAGRIAQLKPHSHRRVELQGRLKDLRNRQLEIENRMRGRT